jgi:hypothetical protein
MFLSFTTWLCSLFLERAGAWATRGITGITLAAAIVILGGAVGSIA